MTGMYLRYADLKKFGKCRRLTRSPAVQHHISDYCPSVRYVSRAMFEFHGPRTSQGMRWIQVFMLCAALIDIYPSITEVGYECEMSFTDSSAALGTFSQVLCWIGYELSPWSVCRHNAMVSFYSELFDQMALFFGLVLLSSPKPSIAYVKITRYLIAFSTVESIVRLIYFSLAYAQGGSFLKESSSCIFGGSSADDGKQMTSEAFNQIIYECLSLMFYTAYIWGTFALVPVLKRGGTGDERVAGSDVLSIVQRNPPKLLVLTSTFGLAPLRPAALILAMGMLGMCCFNGFNNAWRMVYWCGKFEMEAAWCVWPYGIVSAVDQFVCIVACLYTTSCLITMSSGIKFSRVASLWMYVSISSAALLAGSLYIASEKYPAYWMDGMRSDVWVYYARFWMGLVLAVLAYSISIVRLAGGTGAENEVAASDLIYDRLSESKGDGETSETDSLADLFGDNSASMVAAAVADEPAKDFSDYGSSNSRESSAVHTPMIPGSVVAMSGQAVDGLRTSFAS